MADIKNRSLGQLEALYQQKLQHWNHQRAGHLEQVVECDGQIQVLETKLSHIRVLLGGRPGVPMPARLPEPSGKKPQRPRESPVRTAILKVLGNRPGERLSVRQIGAAIREDTSQRVSRQSINVNLDVLERAGLVRRYTAPRGTGAQFVFAAVNAG